MKVRIIYLVLLANVAFWVWFWADVGANLRPVNLRTFDNTPPSYVFGDRAVPAVPNPHNWPSFQIMGVVQFPAQRVADAILGLRYRYDDTSVGDISVGAWRLIVTTLLSFIQWGAIAWAVGCAFANLRRPPYARPL